MSGWIFERALVWREIAAVRAAIEPEFLQRLGR
jgi:hypothetical protein